MKYIIICLIVMLFGCSAPVNNSAPTEPTNTNEETVLKTNEVEEKKFLLVKEEVYHDDYLTMTMIYEYDNLGRLVYSESYAGNETYTYIGDSNMVDIKTVDNLTYNYEYDSSGNKIKEIGSDEEGLFSEIVYVYEGDVLVSEEAFYPYGNTNEYKSYSYENGVLVRVYIETVYEDGESYSYLELYNNGTVYDKPIVIERYNEGVYISYIERLKYEDDLLVEKDFVSFVESSGEVYMVIRNIYTYDENNNLINEISVLQNEVISETRYTYEEFK